MWKQLQNTHYFIYFSDKLEVFITDYIKIWALHFSDNSFLACLIASNIRLQRIDENELLQKGKKMLTNPEELKSVSVALEDGALDVCMRISCGFPLKLNLKLPEGSKELKVTQSLLQVIQDLKSSEQELRHLLQKKDKEIKEYKLEGGKIALKTLKTVPFNDEAHTKKYEAYNTNFGSPGVPKHLLEKTVSLPESNNVPLKQEETERLQEENDINGISVPTKTELEIKIKKENLIEQSEKWPTIKLESETQINNETVDKQLENLGLKKPVIKTETVIQVKNEIKTELQSDSQSSTVSPRKKRKIKLNF